MFLWQLSCKTVCFYQHPHRNFPAFFFFYLQEISHLQCFDWSTGRLLPPTHTHTSHLIKGWFEYVDGEIHVWLSLSLFSPHSSLHSPTLKGTALEFHIDAEMLPRRFQSLPLMRSDKIRCYKLYSNQYEPFFMMAPVSSCRWTEGVIENILLVFLRLRQQFK